MFEISLFWDSVPINNIITIWCSDLSYIIQCIALGKHNILFIVCTCIMYIMQIHIVIHLNRHQ